MRPDGSAPLDIPVSAKSEAASGDPGAAVRPSPRAAGKSAAGASRRAPERRMADAHVGNVLRSVYQDAVQEDIPAEMLDLLSKLD